MKNAIGSCPICSGNMYVEQLACGRCNTKLSGEFELCKFCKLSKDHILFVETFIKNRGNIKEIEKELGISYPTVRNKLDAVITALGYSIKNT